MALSDFLEFGGEAVIRGILSRLDPSVILQRNKLTELAYGFVVENLRRKGRNTSGISEGEMRSIIGDIARAMREGQRYQPGNPGTPDGTRIPNYPGSPGGEQLQYTVRVRIEMPDGTTADVITQVISDTVLSPGQIFAAVVDNIGQRFNIVSDPRKAARAGAEIKDYSVLTVYRGVYA